MKGFIGAGVTGLALALCFPTAALWPLAWLALLPLLLATLHEPNRGPSLFVVTGALFHSANLPWIRDVMVSYGGLSPVLATGVFLLLVAYLAVFWVMLGCIVRWLLHRFGTVGLLGLPVAWLTIEQLRNYPFGGFPWCLLGYSQVGADLISQSAAVVGVHGLSFLLVWVQCAVVVWFVPIDGLLSRRIRTSASVVASVAVVGCLVYGAWVLSTKLPEPEFRVAAVQGNVAQGRKWDPDFAVHIFAEHMELSQRAAASGAGLIVWPESSTPFYFDGTPVPADSMRQFARERGVYLLFGGDDREWDEQELLVAYNGAKLIDPTGEVSFRYHKMHLVPFGEYVPMPDWLGLGAIVQAVGDFRPGLEAKIGDAGQARVGVSICYEVIKSSLIREFVQRGAGLLLNITNDAWFGESAAPYQHFAMARMRAIETRRYLVRAANTGISSFVDPFGRVLQQTELFEQTVIIDSVSARSDQTLFVRYGNVLGRLSVVLTCGFLFFCLVDTLRPVGLGFGVRRREQKQNH